MGILSPNQEQELPERDAISHALGADFSADRSVQWMVCKYRRTNMWRDNKVVNERGTTLYQEHLCECVLNREGTQGNECVWLEGFFMCSSALLSDKTPWRENHLTRAWELSRGETVSLALYWRTYTKPLNHLMHLKSECATEGCRKY